MSNFALGELAAWEFCDWLEQHHGILLPGTAKQELQRRFAEFDSNVASYAGRLVRLREALRPFAEYVRLHDGLDAQDGMALKRDIKAVDYHQRGCPTYGDCRAALRVLEETA